MLLYKMKFFEIIERINGRADIVAEQAKPLATVPTSHIGDTFSASLGTVEDGLSTVGPVLMWQNQKNIQASAVGTIWGVN